VFSVIRSATIYRYVAPWRKERAKARSSECAKTWNHWTREYVIEITHQSASCIVIFRRHRLLRSRPSSLHCPWKNAGNHDHEQITRPFKVLLIATTSRSHIDYVSRVRVSELNHFAIVSRVSRDRRWKRNALGMNGSYYRPTLTFVTTKFSFVHLKTSARQQLHTDVVAIAIAIAAIVVWWIHWIRIRWNMLYNRKRAVINSSVQHLTFDSILPITRLYKLYLWALKIRDECRIYLDVRQSSAKNGARLCTFNVNVVANNKIDANRKRNRYELLNASSYDRDIIKIKSI